MTTDPFHPNNVVKKISQFEYGEDQTLRKNMLSRRLIFIILTATILLSVVYLNIRDRIKWHMVQNGWHKSTVYLPAPPPLMDGVFRNKDIHFEWDYSPLKAAEEEEDPTIAPCNLRVTGRYLNNFVDPAQAKYCLRGKSIVLFGDSLTRYQYLNLIHFIETGVWSSRPPRNECEKEWDDWPTFYQGTNSRLNGREVCDCYREEPANREGNLENRYYYNEEHEIYISFFQWFDEHSGHRGHDLDALNVAIPPTRRERMERLQRKDTMMMTSSASAEENNGDRRAFRSPQRAPNDDDLLNTNSTTPPPRQQYCEAGYCNSTSHWSYNIYDFLTNVVSQLKPDYLIFNSGHWQTLPAEYDLPRLISSLKESVNRQGQGDGHVIFKTTTAHRELNVILTSEDEVIKAFEEAGVHIFDARAMTIGARTLEPYLNYTYHKHLYWDSLHFYWPVYAGLNKVLLNYVCPY